MKKMMKMGEPDPSINMVVDGKQVMNVEFIRRLTYNICEYIKGIDTGNTTYFYSFILLGSVDGIYHYTEHNNAVRICVVCNRWDMFERINMFGVHFEVFTTDFLKGIYDLSEAVELIFDYESEILENTIL